MIAPRDATSDTMKRALAYTLAALEAAAELDVDHADDKVFFTKERENLLPYLKPVTETERDLEDYDLGDGTRFQSRVAVGDAVLDRGYVNGKARMKVELKIKDPDAADRVFGPRTADTTRADIRIEPNLVLAAVARFPHTADFTGKDALKEDLTGRANQQQSCLQEREKGTLSRVGKKSAKDASILAASDALYGLEKRLLERFTREKDYVSRFFFDVTPTKKPTPDPAPPVDPSQKPAADAGASTEK